MSAQIRFNPLAVCRCCRSIGKRSIKNIPEALRVLKDSEKYFSLNGLPALDKMRKQLRFAIASTQDQTTRQDAVIAKTHAETTQQEDGWEDLKLDEKGRLVPVDTRPFSLCPGKFSQYSFAVHREQRARKYQEDGYLKPTEIQFLWGKEVKTGLLFGVFDGHGDGGKVSQFLNERFKAVLEELFMRAGSGKHCGKKYKRLDEEAIGDLFTQAFHCLSKLYAAQGGGCGATAVCGFVLDGKIYFPNVGDSRAILIKSPYVLQVTEDAGVEKERFQRSHNRAGNPIIQIKKGDVDWGLRLVSPYDPGGFFFGGLNVLRDVGAFPHLCSRPKITCIQIGKERDDFEEGTVFAAKGDFILLGSDGLFDCNSSRYIGNKVKSMVKEGKSLQEICKLLVENCGSADNTTAMIVAI